MRATRSSRTDDLDRSSLVAAIVEYCQPSRHRSSGDLFHGNLARQCSRGLSGLRGTTAAVAWHSEHPAPLLIWFRPTTAAKNRVEFAVVVDRMSNSLGEIRRSN
jgi:hypothetical protein